MPGPRHWSLVGATRLTSQGRRHKNGRRDRGAGLRLDLRGQVRDASQPCRAAAPVAVTRTWGASVTRSRPRRGLGPGWEGRQPPEGRRGGHMPFPAFPVGAATMAPRGGRRCARRRRRPGRGRPRGGRGPSRPSPRRAPAAASAARACVRRDGSRKIVNDGRGVADLVPRVTRGRRMALSGGCRRRLRRGPVTGARTPRRPGHWRRPRPESRRDPTSGRSGPRRTPDPPRMHPGRRAHGPARGWGLRTRFRPGESLVPASSSKRQSSAGRAVAGATAKRVWRRPKATRSQ